jgi:thiol-disulfide isomerase/thioredoxin
MVNLSKVKNANSSKSSKSSKSANSAKNEKNMEKLKNIVSKHSVFSLLLLIIVVFIGGFLVNSFLGVPMMSSFEGFTSKPTLTYYYMNGCGHCDNFTPIWSEFESKNEKDITLSKVENAAIPTSVKSEIKGFPTVLLDKKDGSKSIEFNGERTIEGLNTFLGENL